VSKVLLASKTLNVDAQPGSQLWWKFLGALRSVNQQRGKPNTKQHSDTLASSISFKQPALADFWDPDAPATNSKD
jgi:hypothetical protein